VHQHLRRATLNDLTKFRKRWPHYDVTKQCRS